MASSSKCLLFMFLCLTVLLIPEATKTDDSQRRRIFVIGLCSKIPDCNKKCFESHYAGGKCFKLTPSATELLCGCNI
ncbi:unnamed protein product [Thlaspi arvense]|uniref:Uncharacterized protein n=1 Tax=Thlaspi arvense TaxID=13288 RepID=A0AAU9T9A3_THLAR|nr:unnamed protein product [Thlaspi arvense]